MSTKRLINAESHCHFHQAGERVGFHLLHHLASVSRHDDLYAFPKPGDSGKSILILNVHPSVGVNPPGPTTKEAFAPGALYELKIDTDGDAVADIAYGVSFASSEDGKQTATLRRTQGARAAGVCDEGEVLVEGAPVSVGREALLTKAGDYHFFAGWRSIARRAARDGSETRALLGD